ncbi:hypothetical protein [Amycolatopsis sp. NPDC051128]|uniref:hypothetical protein n=1 Tax=Amycolatopsis sp. NPDC051128 TaxID=3155412 RepID=UPI003416CDBF
MSAEEGAEKLAALAKRLKGAPKELRSELTKAVTKAVAPLKKSAKKSARDRLPQQGGLAKQVSKTTLRHKRKNTGRDVGIRIEAQTNAVKDPLRIDRGRVRHLTYGHKPWVLQDVRKGWFTDPLEAGAPEVRKDLTAAMDTVARKIEES